MEKHIYWVQLGPEIVLKNSNHKRMVFCRCICGTEKFVSKQSILHGQSTNCGCRRKRVTTHGMSGTRIYNIWMSMRGRCNYKNNPAYKYYGARGIKVCKRWDKFENFYKDMGNIRTGRSLDRTDNNGHYSPKNCRWATIKEQANNKRSNVLYEYMGTKTTLSQISKITGIKRNTLWHRMKIIGLSLKEAINF